MTTSPVTPGNDKPSHAVLDGILADIVYVDPENVTENDDRPDDVVVFIDTPLDWPAGRKIRIRLNDAVIYEGDPQRDNITDVFATVLHDYYFNGRDLVL